MAVDSRMLVAHKTSDDPNVACYIPPSSLIERLRRRFRNGVRRRALRSYASTRPEGLELFSSDQSQYGGDPIAALPPNTIANLHWVSGFVDYSSVFDLSLRSHIVWTLHDMNPITGGCHYNAGCRAYISGCGSCPQLGSTAKHDLAYAIFQRKHRALSRIPVRNIRVVSPSRWLADEACKSVLFRELSISVIPYGLDVEAFQPRDKVAARMALGLASEAKVVLFVAADVGSQRKGFDLLLSALKELDGCQGIQLLTVGGGKCVLPTELSHCHVGEVNSDRILSAVYSAADVFVIPSRQDNLPLTALEALACGTPVIGFGSGGMPDIVRPYITGLLARPEDVRDLRDAIATLLGDSNLRHELSVSCRQIATREYGLEVQASRYIKLYKSLLNNTK
jgi:glycosyltransferase involved in cell wall biosynthesis